MRERSGAACPRAKRLAPKRGLQYGIGLAIAAAFCTGPAQAATTNLPALVSPASPARFPGKMVFAALVTPDLVGAERFYTNLFRWQFQNAYAGNILIGQASFDGRIVAAIVQRPLREGQAPAWRSFLSTADVDGAVNLAVQHGAKLLVPPHDLANLGRDALLADPQGAVFGMLMSSSGDPADTLAAPGEWIWSSLVTTDPAADANFYKMTFGYQTFDAADPQDPRHLTLTSQNLARASINPIPADHPVSRPRWISYVRVEDMNAVVATASTLGAHVVVPPHQDRNGGSIALLADPAGALFGLLEWADDPGINASGQAAGDAK